MICQHWFSMKNYNLPIWKAITFATIIPADDLTLPGAGASTVMVLIQFAKKILLYTHKRLHQCLFVCLPLVLAMEMVGGILSGFFLYFAYKYFGMRSRGSFGYGYVTWLYNGQICYICILDFDIWIFLFIFDFHLQPLMCWMLHCFCHFVFIVR